MENEYKLLSYVENFFSKLMAASGASKNWFVNNYPSEIDKGWKDMIFVDLNPQNDRDAYTFGSASIYLYSKPTGKLYRKDLKAMLAMEQKLQKAIEGSEDEHYVIGEVNWRDTGFDKDAQFFYNIINVQVIIK